MTPPAGMQMKEERVSMTPHEFLPDYFYAPGCATEAAYDVALRRMCDRGAAEFAAGRCKGLHLRIWSTEVGKVEAYMAEKHPGVPYKMTWPVWHQPSPATNVAPSSPPSQPEPPQHPRSPQ